jgi:predicted RNA-binding protein associated with RNAse of E/G family
MFDADSRVVQWYIDISRQNGLDQRSIPWWDDLYLDVVVFTSGEVMLLDEDELEQARQDGEIDQADYELARAEAERLLTAITANQFPLLQLSQTHRGLLLAKSNRF